MAPAHADTPGQWAWPLGVGQGKNIISEFNPPESDYGPGHRGIDLPAAHGEEVVAVASGTVVFIGKIDGVPNIAIDHGSDRSTYQPVNADVHEGDRIATGDVIGTLTNRGAHCASTCLHLGRVQGDEYRDPAELLDEVGRFILISPDGDVPQPPSDNISHSDFDWPVSGPITSPFGMRTHPITGVTKLHDGTDIGAPCQTPVHAAAAGTVVGRSADAAYGKRVLIEHGNGIVSAYNHLSQQQVAVGQHVTPDDTVGLVGQTGLATGCHLHFMVLAHDKPVEPIDWLRSKD